MTTATLRITGHHLPGRAWAEHANVHLGVQHRADVIDPVAGDAERAVFEIALDVVRDPATGVDYRGPYAQGRRGQRFVYLSWGDLAADGTFVMFRRAKLQLHDVPEHIAEALADGRTVDAELELTDSHGGPICATVSSASIRWTIDPRNA